jgi:superfamily II DNA or RNA helicase
MIAENSIFFINTEGVITFVSPQEDLLRPYQIENRNAIIKAWRDGCRSVMYQSPTGSGKTVTIGSIVKMYDEQGLKTLTLAHRDELVDNIRKEYFELFDIITSPIKAGLRRDYTIRHQVASIATYVNALDFDPDLIITDEGHHCIAKSYLMIYAKHRHAKLLMVTATPYRLSGLGFTDICDEIVVGLSVKQLEKMGNLVTAKLWAMTTFSQEEIEQIDIFQGDYSEGQMADLLSEARQIMSVVDTYIEKGEGKQMMLYATSVEHSKKLVEAFEWRGIKAGHVDGKTKDRKQVFEQFINKEIQVLSNCEIATEGNNIPGIEIIGLARKTKSLALYLQMVGRASRPIDGKTEYILFDFVDNYWDHGMPNREHDWKEHFKGITKKERIKKESEEERQFELMSETGEVFISSLKKLPNGFKGQILQEVDPLNTKQAEILRRRQEKLDEIERKKRAKEEAIEKKLAEIQRRKEIKEAEIQRKIEEKLAEIERKKRAKEEALERKLAAIQKRKEAKEAEIQRKIDAKQAKIQEKLDEAAKKAQKIEMNRLARIRAEEERERSWQRSSLIRDIQREEYTRRRNTAYEFHAKLKTAEKNRRIVLDEIINRAREDNYATWQAYTTQRELDRAIEKSERLASNSFTFFQRMEVQFELGMRMTHSFKHALSRLYTFCLTKRYPEPTISQLETMAKPYWNHEKLFTKVEFDEAIEKIEIEYRTKLKA